MWIGRARLGSSHWGEGVLLELHDAWGWGHSEGLTELGIQEDIFTHVIGTLEGTSGAAWGLVRHLSPWLTGASF